MSRNHLLIPSAILLALAGRATGQNTPTVTQEAKNSPCSNVVALAGDVKIDCSGLTPAQQKLVDSIPAILHKILVNQLNADVVLAKMDELIQLNTSSGVLLSQAVGSSRKIEIGDSTAMIGFTGPNGTPLLRILKDSSLTVETVGGRIAVSTRLQDASGRMVAEINRNEWKIRPSLIWDRNYNENSLEVRDEAGDVVLQVVVLPDRIRLQGLWREETGAFFEIVKSPDPARPGGLFVIRRATGDPQIVPLKIKPMFEYPSDRHLGELSKP